MADAATKVLIVGAGPTGLALACRLATAGVDHILIDSQAEGANTSRAAVVHARTLEVLEEVGVAAELAGKGLHIRRMDIYDGDRLLAHLGFGDLQSAYPYGLAISQVETEAVLLARLRQLGGDVRRPETFVSMKAGPDQVSAFVTDGGQSREITADYIVAADGMHSAVREASGDRFAGAPDDELFVFADLRLEGGPARDRGQLVFSRDGLLLLVPLPHYRVRLIATLDPAPERPDLTLVQKLLDSSAPAPAPRASDLVWSSASASITDWPSTSASDGVLLAGDAAHVHSPAGGQGMNIGIRDAIELGGRLSEVIGGQAPDTVLDAWAERRLLAGPQRRAPDRPDDPRRNRPHPDRAVASRPDAQRRRPPAGAAARLRRSDGRPERARRRAGMITPCGFAPPPRCRRRTPRRSRAARRTGRRRREVAGVPC